MSDAALFGDTDDAALFGDPPKSKYPAPPSMSKDDQSLGLMFGAADPRVPGDQQATHGDALEVAAPELSPVEKGLKGKFDNDIRFLKAAAPFAAGGVLGKVVGGAIGGMAARPAGGAAEKAAGVIGKAIENSFTHGGVLGTTAKVAQAVAPKATNALASAVTKGIPNAVSAVGAGIAGAAPGVGAAGGNALSNAVERLRASAAISPSAMDFTRRMEEAKNTPLGTVSTGTLGGGE